MIVVKIHIKSIVNFFQSTSSKYFNLVSSKVAYSFRNTNMAQQFLPIKMAIICWALYLVESQKLCIDIYTLFLKFYEAGCFVEVCIYWDT